MAWLAKKAISTDGSAKRNATTAKTAVFAQSTGSRFGTAVKLARIMPVEYSPVITSTDRELRGVDAGERDVERMAVGALVWAHRSPVRGGHRGEDHWQGDRQE